MRIMAIDYGDAHTGIAISDPTGFLAGFTTTIHAYRPEVVADQVVALAVEHGAQELVLGYPKNMNGTIGERGKASEAFSKLLQTEFPDAKITLWDERLSTVAAEKVLIDADLTRKKRKKVIDMMAAVVILQNYLDSLRR